MFHNKKASTNKEQLDNRYYLDMEIAKETKVLGYMFDTRNNNYAHIQYIKKKIKKAEKIIYIANNQRMATWRCF